MTTFTNPTPDQIIHELTKPMIRELPIAPDPATVAALLEAVNSGRPITVVFPGEVVEDSDGHLHMTEPMVHRVGEVVDASEAH